MKIAQYSMLNGCNDRRKSIPYELVKRRPSRRPVGTIGPTIERLGGRVVSSPRLHRRFNLPHAPKTIDIIAKTNIGIAGILVVSIAGSAVLGRDSPTPATHDLCLAGVRPLRV